MPENVPENVLVQGLCTPGADLCCCRAQASSGIVAREYSCSICRGSLRAQKTAKVADGRCSCQMSSAHSDIVACSYCRRTRRAPTVQTLLSQVISTARTCNLVRRHACQRGVDMKAPWRSTDTAAA